MANSPSVISITEVDIPQSPICCSYPEKGITSVYSLVYPATGEYSTGSVPGHFIGKGYCKYWVFRPIRRCEPGLASVCSPNGHTVISIISDSPSHERINEVYSGKCRSKWKV